VPTVWDKTKVLDAVVGQYIVIARKKNNDWYIGGITNHSSREQVIPLNFLDQGNYEAEIYTDALDVKINPNNLVKEIKDITNADSITVQLAGSGGVAITIKKK
jgi:alpha-glucosidase